MLRHAALLCLGGAAEAVVRLGKRCRGVNQVLCTCFAAYPVNSHAILLRGTMSTIQSMERPDDGRLHIAYVAI